MSHVISAFKAEFASTVSIENSKIFFKDQDGKTVVDFREKEEMLAVARRIKAPDFFGKIRHFFLVVFSHSSNETIRDYGTRSLLRDGKEFLLDFYKRHIKHMDPLLDLYKEHKCPIFIEPLYDVSEQQPVGFRFKNQAKS